MTLPLIIRDINTIAEMHAVEELQRDVWGFSEREIVPALMFVASKSVGAILLGAFLNEEMIGFSYGFIGYERGRVTLHSDMLAVKAAHRGHQIGLALKLRQREMALAAGIKTITWTFDPLRVPNAHLNIAKLGAYADDYKIDFYGDATTSFLHRHTSTDRLWVTWPLEDRRVTERSRDQYSISNYEKLVTVGDDAQPIAETTRKLSGIQVIEIPCEIEKLQERSIDLAIAWRMATRAAFTRAFDNGYRVDDFLILTRAENKLGAYLLRPQHELTP